ncbi:hypothetical protein Tco_0390188 [Tanacetum coccineum]
MKIIKGMLVLMKGEKVAANLYQLKGEIMEEAEASVASHSPKRKLIPGITKVSLPFYEYCVINKQHRLKFNASNSRSVSILELAHSDVWQARRNQKVVHYSIHSSIEWSGRADEQNLVRKSKTNVNNFEDTDGDVDGKASQLFRPSYIWKSYGYRLWDPTAYKVVVNKDVVFMEDKIQEIEEGDSTTR